MFRSGTISAVAVLLVSLGTWGVGAGLAQEPEECIAAPKFPVPAGSHWHYRTDQATQKKCWHLSADLAAPSAAGNPGAPETAATSPPAVAPQPAPLALHPTAVEAPLTRPAPLPPPPPRRAQTPALSPGSPVPTPRPVRGNPLPSGQGVAPGPTRLPMRTGAAWPDALPPVGTVTGLSAPPPSLPASRAPPQPEVSSSPGPPGAAVSPGPGVGAPPSSPAADPASGPAMREAAPDPAQDAEPAAAVPEAPGPAASPSASAPAVSKAPPATVSPPSGSTAGQAKPQFRFMPPRVPQQNIGLVLLAVFAVGFVATGFYVRRKMRRIVGLARRRRDILAALAES